MGGFSAMPCRILAPPFVLSVTTARGAVIEKERQMSRLRRNRFGAQDRVEQAGEPSVQVFAPELSQLAGPFSLLPDDPGFPEDTEVMSLGGLGDPELDRA